MTTLRFAMATSTAAAARKRFLRGPYSEGFSEEDIVEVVPAVTRRGKQRIENHQPVWNVIVRLPVRP